MNAASLSELRLRIDRTVRERLIADNDPVVRPERTNRRRDMARRRATQTETSTAARATATRRRKPASRKPAAERAPRTETPPAVVEAPASAWDPGPLVDLLMKDVQAAVAGARRVDPKSGSYFRIMVDKTTLAYVNVSKRALTLDLATPRDRVPDGIAVKEGPNGSLPVKYKLDPTVPDLGLREAVELVKIAAGAAAAA